MAIAVVSFLLAGFVLFSNAFLLFGKLSLDPCHSQRNRDTGCRPLQVVVPGIGYFVTLDADAAGSWGFAFSCIT